MVAGEDSAELADKIHTVMAGGSVLSLTTSSSTPASTRGGKSKAAARARMASASG